MLLSAASLVLAISFGSESVQLSPAELANWQKIAPSVAFLVDGDKSVGAAALIDQRGYFLAHKAVVQKTTLTGRFSDGRTVNLKLRAIDEPTQLVLLIADNWDSDAAPVRLPTAVQGSARLFAVLPIGPIRAQMQTPEVMGVVNPSRRAMSLSEIRFEMPTGNVAGALIFAQSGELLGALNATLQGEEATGDSALSNFLGGMPPKPPARGMQKTLGPAGLTVAYAVGPAALERVVEGFKSPSHEVQHPAIGVFCRDANGMGALVDKITPGSSGHVAGIQPGDIIFEIEGRKIRNQIDFARQLLRQRVGNAIVIRARRGHLELSFSVTVGK